HVGKPRHVVENERLVGEQARDHQRQGGVLGARDRDRSVEPLAPVDANAVHAPSPVSGKRREPTTAPRCTKARIGRKFPRRAERPCLCPTIPAESWDLAGRAASGLPARAFAWTLRRLRFSRSAAPKRRCCLIFSARFSRSSMDARLRPEATRRKPCAVSGHWRARACAIPGRVARIAALAPLSHRLIFASCPALP